MSLDKPTVDDVADCLLELAEATVGKRRGKAIKVANYKARHILLRLGKWKDPSESDADRRRLLRGDKQEKATQ